MIDLPLSVRESLGAPAGGATGVHVPRSDMNLTQPRPPPHPQRNAGPTDTSTGDLDDQRSEVSSEGQGQRPVKGHGPGESVQGQDVPRKMEIEAQIIRPTKAFVIGLHAFTVFLCHYYY